MCIYHHETDHLLDSAYFAVRPELALLAKELFHIRPSALEAGEKRLLLTAQAIASGRRRDRWGHHAQAVIKKFRAHTAPSGQSPLPWQELLEDAQRYDGVEGVASRTGNRPLGTTNRYLVDSSSLSAALAADGSSPARLAESASWPEAFVEALLDGRWPSVSEHTARHLEGRFTTSVVAPIPTAPSTSNEGAVDAASPVSPPSRGMGALLAMGILALAVMALMWTRSPTPESPAPLVEVVGYWDYDEIDGMHLTNGLHLLDSPGAAVGVQWRRRLELVDHDELRQRPRQLWPVELRSVDRRVCINYPNYPTYVAFVDAPGDSADGVYRFGPCE